MRTVPQNTYVTVGMTGPTTVVEPCNPWGLHPYPNLNFLFDPGMYIKNISVKKSGKTGF